MKKVISIALAIVMMMAVCVPAFAVNPITNETEQSGTADVVTTFDDDDWSYIVTYPASMDIPWNDTSEHDMTYSVESQLLIGATLDISVVANNEGIMENSETTETLKFNVIGGETVTFNEVNVANTTAPNVQNGKNVKVAIETFEGKPIGEYIGTLTFVAAYNPPKTA